MIKKFVFVVALLIFLFSSADFIFADEIAEDELVARSGPLAIRNQMPLYLFYLQMAPDKASVIDRNNFEIKADYTVSSITVSAFTPATSLYDIQIDAEVSRITLDLRYGLYDNLEVGIEIPYLGLSHGYLDELVESFEDGIGARTPRSRERQGSYEFDYSFKYNNEYLIHKTSSLKGIGDMVLSAKYQLLKEERWFLPNISLRTAIKLPTGDKDNLLGSGEFDYGFGVMLDKCFFNRIFIYAGANAVMIEKPSFFCEIGIDDQMYSGFLALEYFFTRNFSIVTQVIGNTTPYPQSDTNPLDNEGYEFDLGFNYTLKQKSEISWHFGIGENISAASSPDITLHSGLNWRF